ncbi:MAG: hypothetical protein WB613_21100, partial [Pseudolabrys sp.]
HNIDQRDTIDKKANGKVQIDMRNHPALLLLRGFECPITNAATPKKIAATKLTDRKGSHVWT